MNAKALFENFKDKKILVIGDVMIDAYIYGGVSRISPEAPVPIVNWSRSEERLGGAANVALNIKSLGAKPILCSTVGKDSNGERFLNLLEEEGLPNNGIFQVKDKLTTVKTRIIGNHQQLLRIDEEEISFLAKEQEEEFLGMIQELMATGIDAIVFEDYNKGLLTDSLIRKCIQLANDLNIITTVDPKKDNFFSYQNVTLFKPNLKELKEGLGVTFDIKTEFNLFEKAIQDLENKLGNKLSFVTLSEHGVYIKEGVESVLIPAHIRNISDVSGAGDTVISVATLCLAVGASPEVAASIANLAGGLVCEKTGVVPIDKNQLFDEVIKQYGE
jgi:rfaE bifunctional protein kinase chain/domain